MDYYDSPGFIKRIPPPRSAAKSLTRESCYVDDFPTYDLIYKILRPGIPRYTFFFKQAPYEKRRRNGDFDIYNFSPWYAAPNLTSVEQQMFKDSINKNVPILGTLVVHTDSVDSHQVAYLARNVGESVEVVLFETYDTSKLLFKRDSKWKQAIAEAIKKITGRLTKVESIVPIRTDIQYDDPDDTGRCVMWSLIFLSYLRDLPDLQRATLADFNKIYDDINEKNKTKSGFANLAGRVFGARRKTRRAGVKRIRKKKSQKE